MTMHWHFPSTDGGDHDGINDAGLETFEGDRERFIARECIQNSLDARDDRSSPVVVSFERFRISTHSVPGHEELMNVLYSAKESAQNQDNADRLYNEAIQILGSHEISVLKISDYNTTGLDGADTDSAGGWYRLVRALGVSSMTGDGGGSFGIGKGAPFAASTLRTVFYSTMTKDGNVAFQGKARLSSFKDADQDVRRGMGQFGERFENIKGVSSIRTPDAIPHLFQRADVGTDIFIIGYKATDDRWSEALLRSVLDSFWAAVHDDTLRVQIKDDGRVLYDVNRDTVGGLIDEFATPEEHTKLYYHAMVAPTRTFEASLPLLGRVELYVRVGDGPRNVQGMRRSLMKIHRFARLRVLSDDFVGVFIVSGEEGNGNLRALEPPAHDKWDDKRGSYIHREALKNARHWIVESLKELASERVGNPEEIPELSRYLPEDVERDDLDASSSSSGTEAGDDPDKETADQTSGEDQRDKKPTHTIVDRPSIVKPATGGEGGGSRRKTRSGGGSGGGLPGGAGDPEGKARYIDTADMYVRPREARRNGKRIYILTIVPEKEDSGSLRIVAAGDDGLYGVDLASATDDKGNTYEVADSEIRGVNLEPGVRLEITVELASNRRYALGVE